MGAWLGQERNQVLYSPLSDSYYFVPNAQRVGDSTTLRVVGTKVDVSASVKPLVASILAKHLRALARSSVFDARGYRKLMDAASEVERKARIAPSDEG